MTHADTKFQQFGYDAYGLKRQIWNELSQLTRYTYDDYNRPISVIDPLGKTTQYDYASTQGDATQAQQHTTSSARWVTSPGLIMTKNVYDENFRNTQTVAAYGTSKAATTWFNYDAVGNRTWVVDPRGTPGYTYPHGNAGYTTYTDYDERNRKWQVREPLGHTTQLYYDDGINLTRIIRAVGTPDQTTETKVYDGMNRLTSDTVPKSISPTVNIVTQFTYYPSDGDGNGQSGSLLWQVIDGNNHYFTFQYDAFGSKTRLTYPGGVSYQSWAYNNAQNLKSRTTLNGETQNFTYDNRNRKTGMSWSNAADSATYGYDLVGRLTSASNANSVVTRQYDAAGHLTLDQQNVAGRGTYGVNYPTYDNDGRLTRMYLGGASGYDFTYSYDEMGRFEKIFLTNSSQLFQYYYDAASNETERDSLYNGVNQVYPHDALNRMQYVDVKRGATTLSHEYYTYDAMNRIALVSYGTGNTDSFTYYLDAELKQVVLGDLGHTLTYNLDNGGNRTSVADSVNGTTTYWPNSLNQYTSVSGNTISNGPEHEIQSYNAVTYAYINDEHLKSATSGSTTYSMLYDALGRCVKRTLTGGPTTYYICDGDKPIVEYDSSGTSVGVNVYGKGIDEIVERVAIGSDSNWYAYYPQQNHEGSVNALTDTSGDLIERYRYDAFGAPTIYTAAWGVRANTIYDNRFLFSGREYAATYRSTYNTPAFSFYEYRARAYSPILGRFMSEDPKLFDTGDYNLFRYCHNDPVDFTDPMGLDAMANAMAVAEAVVPGQYEYNQMVANVQSGNYGNAAGWGVTWVSSAVVGVVSGTASTRAQAGFRAARVAMAERRIAAVIGKYKNSPNYLHVAENLRAKAFDVPPHIFAKMSEAQQWAANQKFLDRAITRGGDFLLDKPIKDINSTSGGLRKELGYLSDKGFKLSSDGWRMTRSESLVLKATEEADSHSRHIPMPEPR